MKVKDLIALLGMFDKESEVIVDDIGDIVTLETTEVISAEMSNGQPSTKTKRTEVNILTRNKKDCEWR